MAANLPMRATGLLAAPSQLSEPPPFCIPLDVKGGHQNCSTAAKLSVSFAKVILILRVETHSGAIRRDDESHLSASREHLLQALCHSWRIRSHRVECSHELFRGPRHARRAPALPHRRQEHWGEERNDGVSHATYCNTSTGARHRSSPCLHLLGFEQVSS